MICEMRGCVDQDFALGGRKAYNKGCKCMAVIGQLLNGREFYANSKAYVKRR